MEDTGQRPVALDDQRPGDDDSHAVHVDTRRLQHAATVVLDAMSVPPRMELNLILVDPEQMTALNVEHMGSSGPTDVLAFPLDTIEEAAEDRPSILGDVVLCPDVAAAQAPENNTTTQGEIEMLTVHGILHLLGHDHAEPEEAATMFGLTDTLLARIDGASDDEASNDEASDDGAGIDESATVDAAES